MYVIRENKLKILYKILTIIIICLWCVIGFFALFRFTLKKYVYPLNFEEIVLETAKSNHIDATLLFSIINIESSFNPNAKSDKGAIGLMQITPKTGEYISKMLNVDEYDLYNPKTNIEFGGYYLKYLINRFQNTETAVCAYNAGEGNVSIWLNNPEFSDDKITLKNIPFTETNEYINKFKKTFTKYKKLYVDILDK